MSGTHANRRGAPYRRGATGVAVLAALALAACQLSDTPAEAEREPSAREPVRVQQTSAQEPMRLEKTSVHWRRLGKGFVKKGIPLTARIGRNGELKGKVVVKARTAKRLKLWPNPKKMKDRSVAKKKVRVSSGQRKTMLLKPHKHYRKNFRKAGRRKLRNAKYELRAVLRDRKGRKVARQKRRIEVRG